MFKEQPKMKPVFYCTASGVLLGLSYSYFLWWMAWIALVPFILFLKDTKRGFLSGFFTGLIQSLILLSWTVFAAERFTGQAGFLGWILWIVLSVYMALWLGVFGYCYVKLKKFFADDAPFKLILTTACVWVFLEWFRILFLPGIPWVEYIFATTQSTNLYLIQTSSVFGLFSVSLFVVLLNLLLAEWFTKRKNAIAITWCLLLVGQCVVGGVLVELNSNNVNERVEFALIQENIPPEQKWSEANGDSLAHIFFDLNREAAMMQPDIILWSETAMPWVFTDDDDFMKEVLKITYASKANHLVGYLSESGKSNNSVFNSALLIEADGAVRSVTHKENLLSALEKPLVTTGNTRIPVFSTSVMDNILPGNKGALIRSRYGSIGNLICNESLRAEVARKKVKNGAELLTVMSNNSWFSDNRLLIHHFYITRLMGVANRRDVVINSNWGFAGHINASGKILKKSKSQTSQVLKVSAALESETSLFTKFGDIPLLVALTLLFLTITMNYKSQKK